MITHHWRWRTPRYLTLCGVKNGGINVCDESDITCRRCIGIMVKQEKSYQRPLPKVCPFCSKEVMTWEHILACKGENNENATHR